MIKFIFKRILQAIIMILLITCSTFLLMNLVPGGPFLNEKAQTSEMLETLNEKYGLDESIAIQLKNYIVGLLKGDMGISLKMQKNRPVLTIIMEMFPVSAKIGIIALLSAIIFGIPTGCIAAYNRGNLIDSTLKVITSLGVSIPSFVLAPCLLILFGSALRILPTVGLSGWTSYLMPCFTLAFYPMCYIGRLSRYSVLDVLNQEYIRAAEAKGLPVRLIIFKHALRNSLIPVLTYLGPLTAGIVTGSFVVESVFNIPGIGRYFVQSILNRDYPIIMGTTIFLATLVVTVNLIVDILYRVVDPRINLAKEGTR